MSNIAAYKEISIKTGDTVQVHYRLIEKEIVTGKAKREKKEETRERIQIFEGIVIQIRGEAENKSITVRKIGAGAIGVERIFPLISPWIRDITVKKSAKVRRAKLYYLRGQTGKQATKLKSAETKSPAAKSKNASKKSKSPDLRKSDE